MIIKKNSKLIKEHNNYCTQENCFCRSFLKYKVTPGKINLAEIKYKDFIAALFNELPISIIISKN